MDTDDVARIDAERPSRRSSRVPAARHERRLAQLEGDGVLNGYGGMVSLIETRLS